MQGRRLDGNGAALFKGVEGCATEACQGGDARVHGCGIDEARTLRKCETFTLDVLVCGSHLVWLSFAATTRMSLGQHLLGLLNFPELW